MAVFVFRVSFTLEDNFFMGLVGAGRGRRKYRLSIPDLKFLGSKLLQISGFGNFVYCTNQVSLTQTSETQMLATVSHCVCLAGAPRQQALMRDAQPDCLPQLCCHLQARVRKQLSFGGYRRLTFKPSLPGAPGGP